MDIVHPRVAGSDGHKKIIWVAVRLAGEAPGQRTVTVKSFKTFWRQLQKMAALAGRARRDRRGDGIHRGVLVAGVSRPGSAGDRGVRVQRGAHAQRAGPQDGQMCRLHLDAYDHLGVQVAALDRLVAEAAAPFAALIARLITIPGIGQRTAQVIVAETGGDMTDGDTPQPVP